MKEAIRVAAKSSPRHVAGAIAGELKDSPTIELLAVGASAINQAIKAVAIARGYLAQEDRDIYCVPSFCSVDIEGKARTAIKLTLTKSIVLIKSA